MNNKKGLSIQDMAPLSIAMVFIAVVLGIGATVLSDVQADQVTATTACGLNSSGGTEGTLLYTGCGYDYNASANGLNAVDTFSGWLPTIALVVAAAIVIGVLSFFRS